MRGINRWCMYEASASLTGCDWVSRGVATPGPRACRLRWGKPDSQGRGDPAEPKRRQTNAYNWKWGITRAVYLETTPLSAVRHMQKAVRR